jgi:hypothetical protein
MALLRTLSDVQCYGATGKRAWNLARRNGETIKGQGMIVGAGKGTGSGVAMYVEGVQTHLFLIAFGARATPAVHRRKHYTSA